MLHYAEFMLLMTSELCMEMPFTSSMTFVALLAGEGLLLGRRSDGADLIRQELHQTHDIHEHLADVFDLSAQVPHGQRPCNVLHVTDTPLHVDGDALRHPPHGLHLTFEYRLIAAPVDIGHTQNLRRSDTENRSERNDTVDSF